MNAGSNSIDNFFEAKLPNRLLLASEIYCLQKAKQIRRANS
jgi:hypothetical protein